MVENDFLHLLVNLLLFTKDNVTLTLDGCVLELGVLEDVGKDVDGRGHVGIEGFGVVYGVFALQ